MDTAKNSYSNLTDAEIVDLTIQDQNVFLYIINRYEKPLYWYIKRISSCRDEEIEDILQDVFIKVYQNLNNYKPNLKFSSWIYRIARNLAIDYYRKNKKNINSDDTDEWFLDRAMLKHITDDFNVDDNIDNKALAEKIKSILNKMDLKYREVMIYKYFEEKSYEEIADILKKPIGTVGTLINRAKKQFIKISEQEKTEF